MMDTLVQTWNDLRDFVFAGGSAGTEVTRSHSWPWGPSVTMVLVAAAAGWVIYVYVRERGRAGPVMKTVLASLRIALIVLVVFLLYGWMLNRHRTDLPDLVLLIDDSASMATIDDYRDAKQQAELTRRLQSAGLQQPARVELAKLLLLERDANLLRQLQQRYRLKVYRAGGSARPLTGGDAAPAGGSRESPAGMAELRGLEAGEPTSRLGKSLQDVLAIQRGRPTAALILLTDGVTTEGKTISEAASEARRKAVPLFLIGLGNSRPPRDVRVADLLVDDVVFAGDLVHFDFKVAAAGYDGQQATVRLTVKGQESQVLAEQQITLGKDGVPQSVRLSYRPTDKGDFEFAVDVEPLTGEANGENNRQTRVVKVRDDALRVLYVQAYPSYDFRYLKTVLGRSLKRDSKDKAVELTTVLQDADLEYAELDETAARVFPVNREELFTYDVLIFGDVNPSFLSRSVMENIVAFVEQRGGGLVVLAGPRYTPLAYRDTPLAALLPVNLETASAPLP
ncbi:MAG: VWA domain-containing protein, partial [Pirellulaceae bacterium]|nr:VWA domain-containing protein [Pirellulaceae bacterium]